MVIGRSEKVVDGVFNIILVCLGLVFVIPLLYVFSVSFTPYAEVLKNGGFILIPRSVTLDAYKELFRQGFVLQSMGVTLKITVGGTLLDMTLTVLLAYPLSRRGLPGRTFFLLFILFPRLFTGGMIPTYIVVKDLHLLNTLWALVLPTAVNTFNALVVINYFESVPEEIFESARIDGAKEWRVLLNIVLPLSIPVLMTIMLFYMVGHWNEFFQAIMYITKSELNPLQVVVRQVLTMSRVSDNPDITIPTQTLQSAIVIFASLPIIIVYPFIQKYFTKGMMLGAVKG